MAGPKQLSNQRVSAQNINSSVAALHVVQLDSTGGIISGGAGGGSTQVSVKEILTSSGASVMDSTNNAIGVTIRAGSAAGTEYTDGDVDATVSGTALLFDNSSNTLRPVTLTRGLPVNIVAGSAAGSTIVTVSTGSVRVHQSSAADLNVTAAQTGTWNIGTVTTVSSLAGAVNMRSSAANALVTVYQSSAADLNANVSSVAGRVAIGAYHSGGIISVADSTNSALRVNVVAGAAGGSTEVTIRQSTAADLKTTVYQSSAADLNVTVAGLSTTVAVSSLGGVVRIAGNNAADGIVHVGDSTNNALRVNVVAGSAAGSTTVNVSSLAGAVIVRSSAANALMTAYQSTYTDFQALAGIRDRDQASNTAAVLNGVGASTTYGLIVRLPAPYSDSTNTALRVNVVAGSAAGSTITTVSQLLDSSGGTISAGDNVNQAIRVNVVAGAAAGSTIVTVSTGSVRVHQSSAADLNVTVAGYSTLVAVSSIAGPVTVRSSAANLLASVYQSTAADLNVTATQGGTWNIGTITTVSSVAGVVMTRLQDSSGVGIVGSTGPAAVGVNALTVREVYPTLLSTRAVITSSNSTALYTLVSSAANPLRHKVYAYSITSTETTPSTIVFMSSNTIDRWAVSFGSGSSGVTGANLAMSPPAWLFATDANNALRCLIEKGASTQCIVSVSIAYFTEA